MIENQPTSDDDSGPGAGILAADDTGLLRGEQLISQAEIDEQLEPATDEIVAGATPEPRKS